MSQTSLKGLEKRKGGNEEREKKKYGPGANTGKS